MKNISLFLATLGCCFILSSCYQQGSCPTYTSDIQDIQKTENTTSDNM